MRTLSIFSDLITKKVNFRVEDVCFALTPYNLTDATAPAVLQTVIHAFKEELNLTQEEEVQAYRAIYKLFYLEGLYGLSRR